MRYIYYRYTFSIIVMTYYDNSKVYAIPEGESTILPGLKYTLLSLIFGWWGIPWGPIRVIQVLFVNFGGGEDITSLVKSSTQSYPEALHDTLAHEMKPLINPEGIVELLNIQEDYITKNPDSERGPDNADFVGFAWQKIHGTTLNEALVIAVLTADRNSRKATELAQ